MFDTRKGKRQNFIREMELRRRLKEEKKQATETLVEEVKRKMNEAEKSKRSRQFLVETIVPFCLGLAMFLAGSYFYAKS